MSAKARQAHLDVLFQALSMVLEQASMHVEPFQVFVTVNSTDSPGDALFFHPPNPNVTTFPYTFEGYRWRITPPPWLAQHLNGDRFEVGETDFERETRFVVVPRGRGGRLTNT